MNRKSQIKNILDDLKELKKTETFSNSYALDENIIFFRSLLSIRHFLSWLLIRAPKIDGSRLLELADLPIEKWDLLLHKDLIAIEKKKIPGMLTPLVTEITRNINNNTTLIMDLGSGGMETERQVIKNLISQRLNQKITFIGVDRSKAAHIIASENLNELREYIDFYTISVLDNQKLKDIQLKSQKNIIVVLCENNIFELDKTFLNNSVDLVFHTRFKHHLNNWEGDAVDEITKKIAKISIEFDEYKSYPLMVIQTLFAWWSPVLLNGALFSRLREQSKVTLRKRNNIKFHSTIGTYININRHVI